MAGKKAVVLRYLGHEGLVLPVPEGWPAADHAEEDHAVAAAKIGSGLYDEVREQKRSDD